MRKFMGFHWKLKTFVYSFVTALALTALPARAESDRYFYRVVYQLTDTSGNLVGISVTSSGFVFANSLGEAKDVATNAIELRYPGAKITDGPWVALDDPPTPTIPAQPPKTRWERGIVAIFRKYLGRDPEPEALENFENMAQQQNSLSGVEYNVSTSMEAAHFLILTTIGRAPAEKAAIDTVHEDLLQFGYAKAREKQLSTPEAVRLLFLENVGRLLDWNDPGLVAAVKEEKDRGSAALIEDMRRSHEGVRQIFRVLLGRDPEQSAWDHLDQVAKQGGSKGVVNEIKASSEYRKNHPAG